MRPVSLPKSGRISLAGNHLAGSGRLVRALALLLMPEANMTEGRYQVERDITCASRGGADERAGDPLHG